MNIRHTTSKDILGWSELRHELWPHHSIEQLTLDSEQFFQKEGIVAVAENTEGKLVGFAEISIRHDYVEGCKTSPVPYLEGWHVPPDLRRQKIGRCLIAYVESWARANGYH